MRSCEVMDKCEVCGKLSKDLDYGTTTHGDVLGFCEDCVKKHEAIDIVLGVLGGWSNPPAFVRRIYEATKKAGPMGRVWEIKTKRGETK